MLSIIRHHFANRIIFGARALFFSGIFLFPAFALQSNLIIRIAQVLLFGFLAHCAKKKIQLLYFLMLIVIVAICNTIVPNGTVLWRFGPITITEQSLIGGLHRGLALTGMVFISLFTVRSDLHLPGRFGHLLALMFFYFERLVAQRNRVRIGSWRQDIDGLLETLSPPIRTPSLNPVRTNAYGWVLLLILLTCNWLLLILEK